MGPELSMIICFEVATLDTKITIPKIKMLWGRNKVFPGAWLSPELYFERI